MPPTLFNLMFVDSIPDQSTVYTGPDVPSLGIKKGDTLDAVLSKITAKLVSLSSPSLEVDTSTIRANSSLYGLGGKSIASAQISEKSFTYSIGGTGTKAQLSYDVSDVQAGLPSNYSLIKVSANATDNQNKRTSTSGVTSSLSIANLPATVAFSVGVRTPDGDVQLEKKVFINSNNQDTQTLNLEVRDLTGPNESSDLSLKETLEVLAAKLAIVSQQVETLRSQNLALEIEKLKSQSS